MGYFRFILIYLFTLSILANSAVVIDAFQVLQYSTEKYKDIDKEKVGRKGYYYFLEEYKTLFEKLSRDGVKIFLSIKEDDRKIKRFLSKYDFEDFHVTDILSVNENLITEIFKKHNVNKVHYFGPSFQEVANLSLLASSRYDLLLRAKDLGVSLRYFKTMKEANESLDDLSSGDREKYSGLYPKSEKELTKYKKEINKILSSYLELKFDLGNDAVNVDTNTIYSFLNSSSLDRFKVISTERKIGNLKYSFYDRCEFNFENKTPISLDRSYCLNESGKKSFLWFKEKNNKAICYKTQSGNDDRPNKTINFLTEPTEDSNCFSNDTVYTWIIKNSKITGCGYFSLSGELISKVNDSFTNCVEEKNRPLGVKHLLDLIYKWKTNGNEVVGCETTVNSFGESVSSGKEYSKEKCYKESLAHTLSPYAVNSDAGVTQKCELKTADGYIYNTLSLNECEAYSTRHDLKITFINNRLVCLKHYPSVEGSAFVTDRISCFESLNHNFKYEWIVENGVVEGCSVSGKVNYSYIKSDEVLSTQYCLDIKLLKTKTGYTSLNDIITGCSLQTNDGSFIRETSIDECNKNKNFIYKWVPRANNYPKCVKSIRYSNLYFDEEILDDCMSTMSTLHWKKEDGKTIGCVRLNSVREVVKKYSTLGECVENLGVVYSFSSLEPDKLECTMYDVHRRYEIKDAPFIRCDQSIPYVKITQKFDETNTKLLGCNISHAHGYFSIDSVDPLMCGASYRLLKSQDGRSFEGCHLVNEYSGRSLGKSSLANCEATISELKPTLFFPKRSIEENAKCYLGDKNGISILSEPLNINKCIERFKSNIKYGLKGEDNTNCVASITNDSDGEIHLLSEVDMKYCQENETHILLSKKYHSYIYTSSTEINSGKKIDEVIDESAPAWIKFSKLLAEGFSAFIKTTDRDTFSYNYRPKNEVVGNGLNLNYSDGAFVNSKIAQDYAIEWMSATQKYLPRESGWIGWGFYTANNPFESKDYGDTMLRVKLPSNSRLLDLRYHPNAYIPLTKAAVTFVSDNYLSLSCANGGEFLNGYYFISKTALTKCQYTHLALIKALRDQKLNAYVYSWNFDYFKDYRRRKTCDSDNFNHSTFVMIDTPLTDETVELYNHSEVINPSSSVISSINTITQHYTKLSDRPIRFDWMEKFKTADNVDLDKIIKNEAYGCDDDNVNDLLGDF